MIFAANLIQNKQEKRYFNLVLPLQSVRTMNSDRHESIQHTLIDSSVILDLFTVAKIYYQCCELVCLRQDEFFAPVKSLVNKTVIELSSL